MHSTLLILMWKHLMVRKHKWITTIIELAGTVVLYIIFCERTIDMKPKVKTKPSMLLEPIKYLQKSSINLETMPGPTFVVYTPNTSDTRALMEEVARDLGMYHLDYLPKPDFTTTGFYGGSNETVNKFLPEMNMLQAVVEFKLTIMVNAGLSLDMVIRSIPTPNRTYCHREYAFIPNLSWIRLWEVVEKSIARFDYRQTSGQNIEKFPGQLNYEIKMKNSMPYDLLNENLLPDLKGLFNYPFLRLQWAIDKNYLQMLTGVAVEQQLYLEKLPLSGKTSLDTFMMTNLLSLGKNIGVFIPFVFTMERIIIEKATGVFELIRMAGVSKLTQMFAHFLNCVPSGLLFGIGSVIFLIICLHRNNNNGFLIFLIFELHFFSFIALAILCSFVTSKRDYGITLAVILYTMFNINKNFLLHKTDIPAIVLASAGLLPDVPWCWFMDELEALDKSHEGVNLSTMFESHTNTSFPILLCYIMLVAQIILFSLLSIYMSLVRPGPFGTPLPWNFLWQKPETVAESYDESEQFRDPKYFESVQSNKEVGIKIKNVSKVYKNKKVLNNISLNIYKGEITLLLGHNGAGKTTLMNIITGMTQPTSGQVEVLGVAGNKKILRSQMGLCPQHNLFLHPLNVLEHVVFFAMIKGQSLKEAKASSKNLLTELGLGGKLKANSDHLSGGMKRRLQLACSLSGDARVLILDEPTSGLDVETRRELWDLLLSLRGTRTVLLSTHFMEEADALGDRVVALHEGRLVCNATPIFLKSNIGTGYILTVATDGAPNSYKINEVVTQDVPEANLKEVSPKSVTFNLPTNSSPLFPNLFKSLESRRQDLKIITIGVGMSTLEEVFIRLCSNVGTTFNEEEMNKTITETSSTLIRPPILYFRQMKVLIARLFKFMLRSWLAYLAFQLIIPIAVIIASAIVFSNTSKQSPPPFKLSEFDEDMSLSLSQNNEIRPHHVYLDIKNTSPNITTQLSNTYKNAIFVPSDDIGKDIKKLLNKDVFEYENLLAGLKINTTAIHVFHSAQQPHSADLALNIASNAILRLLTAPWVEEYGANFSIVTNSHPVLYPNEQKLQFDQLGEQERINGVLMLFPIFSIWQAWVNLVFLSTTINVSSLLLMEKRSSTRRLHTMAGCPTWLHWGTRLYFHVILYTITLILPIVLCITLFGYNTKLGSFINLLNFGGIYILGLKSWLSFVYLMSFMMGETLLSFFLTICLTIGIFCAYMECFVTLYDNEFPSVVMFFVYISGIILPPHSMHLAGLKVLYMIVNAEIGGFLNKDSPDLNYWTWGKEKPLIDVVRLIVQSFYQMALVIMTEEGVFNVVSRLYALVAEPQPRRFSEPNVEKEALYVKELIDEPDSDKDSMLVHDVHKTYLPLIPILMKPVHPVKGISISVAKGECFGLLGVNGAGKSTTFKMMVAESGITRGQIWANGYYLRMAKGKYLKTLSYCPQFLGIDTFLTARQNLTLILTMRGLSNEDIERDTSLWISILGLEELQDLPVSSLSGGCQRRLSAACALSTASPLTLMDEPTAGVDVTARRRVWYAAKKALSAGRAIIITSHSMDEMEALCERVAIMSAGEICALGTIPELRSQHATGFSLRIKCAYTGKDRTPIDNLKHYLEDTFTCRLIDEHETMLHYHIDQVMAYSELFEKLEKMKADHIELIEDYTVNETTLEEVFLSFAQKSSERV